MNQHFIFALTLMVLSAVALIQYGQSIVRVLLVCALIGLVGNYFNLN